MPKDRSHSHFPSDQSRTSPYHRTSKNKEKCISKNTLQSVGDEREWEEARCAICMEHPHNAVLLFCSSHEKGCRPYMCDTSHRHSNCLDQYRKSSPSIQQNNINEDFHFPRSKHIKFFENKLPCPLCRGQISGSMVLESARAFMNLKTRNCSLENCEFIGNYLDLRKHARREHPSVRPTEADPTRQEEWTRSENETTFQDLLGVSAQGNELNDFENSFINDFASFFSELESESDWDEEPNIDLELPFTFMEMPSFLNDSYYTSIYRSPERSYRERTIEFNISMGPPVNRTRGNPLSSRRNPDLDRNWPDRRWF